MGLSEQYPEQGLQLAVPRVQRPPDIKEERLRCARNGDYAAARRDDRIRRQHRRRDAVPLTIDGHIGPMITAHARIRRQPIEMDGIGIDLAGVGNHVPRGVAYDEEHVTRQSVCRTGTADVVILPGMLARSPRGVVPDRSLGQQLLGRALDRIVDVAVQRTLDDEIDHEPDDEHRERNRDRVRNRQLDAGAPEHQELRMA